MMRQSSTLGGEICKTNGHFTFLVVTKGWWGLTGGKDVWILTYSVGGSSAPVTPHLSPARGKTSQTGGGRTRLVLRNYTGDQPVPVTRCSGNLISSLTTTSSRFPHSAWSRVERGRCFNKRQKQSYVKCFESVFSIKIGFWQNYWFEKEFPRIY